MSVRTLIISQNAAEQSALCDLFERMQLHAHLYSSPDLARDSLRDDGFDLAIIPYEGDGFGLPLAVSLRLRKGTGTESLDCIVVTDQVCPALAKAASDLGLLAVLQRPVTAKALATAVESHIAKRIDRRDAGAPKV